jgi:Ca-activated chloride channel family protein
MNFIWPSMLLLLLLVPLLVLVYLWLLQRKKKIAVRYASLGLVKQAMGGASWRRHVPPLLFLLAITALLLAAARPLAVILLPTQQETIMLAMDVSGSMRAADVKPNRLEASQVAAKAFLAEMPRNVKVGIVAFAGSAQVAQIPTVNREDLVTAIDRFQLQRGTAIGNGLVLSLATLFPDAGIDIGNLTYGRSRGISLDQPPAASCSRTASAPRALTPWKPPRWPPTAACASTPWAWAPWTARPSVSKAGPCTCAWTRKPSRPSRTAPRASTSTPPPPKT